MDRKLRCTRVAYIIRIIHFKDWSIIQLVFQCLWYSCFQDLQNNLANFPAAPKPIFDVSPTHLLLLGEASGVISNEVGETSSGHQQVSASLEGHCWTSNSFQAQIMQIHPGVIFQGDDVQCTLYIHNPFPNYLLQNASLQITTKCKVASLKNDSRISNTT